MSQAPSNEVPQMSQAPSNIEYACMSASARMLPHAGLLRASLAACGALDGARMRIMVPERTQMDKCATHDAALYAVGMTVQDEGETADSDVCRFPFSDPADWPRFPFLDKVHAAAAAERLAADADADVLVWLDADSLFFRAPERTLLGPGQWFAGRPVDKCLIASRADGPPDPFWRAMYDHFELHDTSIPIFEPSTEPVPIRAYWNAGFLAVRPQAGLLQGWQDALDLLIGRDPFRSFCLTSPHHAIFLHQAVLAGTILQRTSASQRKLLDARYAQPLHLCEAAPYPIPGTDTVSCRYDTWFERSPCDVGLLPPHIVALLPDKLDLLALPWQYSTSPL